MREYSRRVGCVGRSVEEVSQGTRLTYLAKVPCMLSYILEASRTDRLGSNIIQYCIKSFGLESQGKGAFTQ